MKAITKTAKITATPDEKKEQIVQVARLIFTKRFQGDLPYGPSAACLYWAACVTFAAKKFGVNLVVQAGTASFLRLPHHLDDGEPTTPTHFSYVCDKSLSMSTVAAHLDFGRLPEMHVWAADPGRQEIVDLTTKFLPEQCKRLSGLDWLTPAPPDYLWCKVSRLPEEWVYAPNADATFLAMMLIAETCAADIKAAMH